MKHILTLIILFVFSTNLFSQYFALDTVKGESPYNSEFNFIFPHFSNPSDQDAVDEINKDLVRSVLNLELGQQRQSIFENIWGDKELAIAKVSDISFKVINDDADFLCLSISATSCGTICDNWTRYYVYESKSGKQVLLSDLFVGGGLQLISDSVSAMKARRIKERIMTLEKDLGTQPLSDDDKRDYKDAINVLNRYILRPEQYEVYTIDHKHLTIYSGHYLSFDLQTLDKTDHAFVFDLDGFKNYLTDYGKSLLH